VDVQNSDTGTLFIAGIPEFINVDSPKLLVTPEDSVRVIAPPGETLRYEVSAHSGPPLPSSLTNGERARYLALPPLDIRIYSLARAWAGSDGTPIERALGIQRHLQRDFKYKLEGSEKPVRDPLSDFLFVRKEGYCEYFASAMAVMLRAQGIPARVATGFLSGYFNDVSGLYVVRASDAHAWVEAWIDGRGWMTFDPTPAVSSAARPGILARLNMYLDAADHAWQEWVVSYDLSHQVAIAAKFEAALRGWNRPSTRAGVTWSTRVRSWSKAWVAGSVGSLFLVFSVTLFGPGFWREWRKKARLRRIIRSGGSSSDAGVLYERMLEMLARRGFKKPDWFTPIEFARHLPMEEGARVMEFTEVYNSIRFGGEISATSKLAAMLQEFERQSRRRKMATA
jgi:hypothetical protein